MPHLAVETEVDANERARIEQVIALLQAAREALGPGGSFRLRVLTDMALLELGKELAKWSDDEAG